MLTVAISGLLLVQITLLFVLLSGFTVAINVSVFPIVTISAVLFSVILSTNTFVAVISAVFSTSPASFFATTFIMYSVPPVIPVSCVAPVCSLTFVICLYALSFSVFCL